jgi:class 3 adenylate cyclase
MVVLRHLTDSAAVARTSAATRRGAQSLPTGTVTFLFTDIERSTQRVKALGAERWEDILEVHARIIREALTANGGAEVKTEGDAFFAVFVRPSAAIAAAASAQRELNSATWPADATIRVRMGIHTGEARPATPESGADYVGLEVHRASRIASVAHGGQVLLSDATAQLVRDAIDPALSLRDLGDRSDGRLPAPAIARRGPKQPARAAHIVHRSGERTR